MPKPTRTVLSDAEEQFIAAYFKLGCSVAAAVKAIGRDGEWGHRALRRGCVRRAIERKHGTMNMGANEVISRLATFARASMDDLLDEAGTFSIEKARATGGIHSIRSLREKTTAWEGKDGALHEKREVVVELESRQNALGMLARYHALLTDVIALRDIPHDDRAVNALLLAELQRVRGSLPPEMEERLKRLLPTAVRVGPGIADDGEDPAGTLPRLGLKREGDAGAP